VNFPVIIRQALNGGGPAAWYEADYQDQLEALMQVAEAGDVAPRNCSRCGTETDPTVDLGICPGCGHGTWTLSLFTGEAFEAIKSSTGSPQKFRDSAERLAYVAAKRAEKLPPSIRLAGVAVGPERDQGEDLAAMAGIVRKIRAVRRRQRNLRPMTEEMHEKIEDEIRDLWQDFRIAKTGPRVLLDRTGSPPDPAPLPAKKRPPCNRSRRPEAQIVVTRATGEVETYRSSSEFRKKVKAGP
jgi:hypothetical protein